MSSPKPPALPKPHDPQSIILVPYPKIILLYPTFIMAIVAGCYMSFFAPSSDVAASPVAAAAAIEPAEGAGAQSTPGLSQAKPGSSVALIFLAIFGLNLVVYAFDFPRTTSLTLFFLAVAIGLGLMLLIQYMPSLLPWMYNVLVWIQPTADATFYWCFTVILGAIYLGVLFNIKFDYWEVRPNELLHHHGYLSNLERFSAPSLRISKEINDVFEFMLLGSGRLILHPSNEPRAIVLDNIVNISKREAEITRMLGALQVSVRQEGE